MSDPIVVGPDVSETDVPGVAALLTPTLRRARASTSLVFFVNGAVLASWVPRIPAVKAHLHLSNGTLGLALLGPAVGALVAMQFAGPLTRRWGSRPVTVIAVLTYCALLVMPALAPNLWSLTLALVLFGAGNGLLDVAMNTHAIAVQNGYGRPIMSSLHAAFSLGGLVGAATGGLAARAGLSVTTHFLLAAGFFGVLAAFGSTGLLPADVDRVPREVHVVRSRPATSVNWAWPVLVLGALGFCSLVGEGAAADWSAVYLRDSLGSAAAAAAAGYIGFSATMVAGRMMGDRLTVRLGPVRLVRLSAGLAAVGLGAGIAVGNQLGAVLGFTALGAGLSVLIPLLFSAAGNMPHVQAGSALARVSTLSYLGLLAGPPLIGAIASVSSLRTALLLPAALAGVVAIAAGVIAPDRGR